MIKKIFLYGLALFLITLPLRGKAQFLGQGVTVSPPTMEKTLKPGETVSETIKLSNPTKSLVEVYPVVMNFKAKGEGGEPDFYESGSGEEKFSLASWIKFSQAKIALTPEQVADWNYQIAVPQGAEPGGHYGVIFFATEPPKLTGEKSAIGLASMIGSLILVKVPGAVVEQGALQEFSAKKFYFNPPVQFTIRIANTGNVHFKPQGEIVIKNWRGKTVGEVEINQAKGNVLPESTRKFEEKWSTKSLVVGRFVANLQVAYGEGGKTLNSGFSFWIVPLWAMIVAVLVLALIIIGLIRLKKKFKKSNKVESSKKIILR